MQKRFFLLRVQELMETEQLEKFKVWFGEHVAGFYGDDPYVNANLKLKEDHTRRTCTEMLYLAEELALPENQKRIAEVIALFHDIGRFTQFVKYRTYNDPRSENHCLLGLDVLRQTNVLEPVAAEERELIERAVEYHGIRELPDDLDGQCLLFSKMIRDADKLDVFYLTTEAYARYAENPGELELPIELPDEPYCSPGVLEAVLAGRLVDYSELKTLNDMKLLQLGWVYNVNFTATLRRIQKRGFLKTLFGFLPNSEDIENVKEKILAYVDFRIERDA